MATGWHMTEEPVIPISSVLLQAGICLFVITGMACETHDTRSFTQSSTQYIQLHTNKCTHDFIHPEHNIQDQVSAGCVLS